jgi:S-adenosylmethionine/arginine decarboxylase-like enzyme
MKAGLSATGFSILIVVLSYLAVHTFPISIA